MLIAEDIKEIILEEINKNEYRSRKWERLNNKRLAQDYEHRARTLKSVIQLLERGRRELTW